MRILSRVIALVALVAGLAVLPGSPANAAYYNTYDDIAATPDASGTTGAQAFAAGSTYLYSVKNRTSDDGRAAIYRVDKATGARVVMRNGTDGLAYNTWLGHANDMTIVDIDGEHHFFVVTMEKTGAQLVKLRYDGTTYYKAGSYKITLDGAVAAPSGVTRVAVSSTTIRFFFKSGRQVYNGTLPLRADTGTIAITRAFVLDVAGALVNGATVSDLDTFSHQGVFYDAANQTLYVPLTKDNRSIVLVYRSVTPARTATATSDENLSFRITSSAYSKFEIEGVGLSGGRLYFNTNRANSTGAHDGVHVFKSYAV